MFSLDQIFSLESFHRHLLVVFWTELIFLNQIRVLFSNWNHQWKCKNQTENFPTIMVLIFWNFTMFYCRPNEPPVQ